MGSLPGKFQTALGSDLTSHALLVPWGLFAQETGLIKGVQTVPIPQRTRDHAPQAKVLEMFVGILGGSAYLPACCRQAGHQPRPAPSESRSGRGAGLGTRRLGGLQRHQPHAQGLYAGHRRGLGGRPCGRQPSLH